MNLAEYLSSPDALSVRALADAIGLTGDERDQQVRQWERGYAGRKPGPAMCVRIEAATKKKVRRWDLRPEDWHLIWPELKRVAGAPEVTAAPEQKAA